MCSNYTPSSRDQLQEHFGVAPPDSDYPSESYPGYMSPIIRLPKSDAVIGDRACMLAMFGMVPHWAESKLSRQTYNARTETVATKPSFRNAFKKSQFCVVPAASFYEPCYETGKPIREEIMAADGTALGIAGIWEYKHEGENGLPLISFSMLTINADNHPVMQRFHKPTDEKRMLVILRPDQYDEWLHCPSADADEFFTQYLPEALATRAAPKPPRKTAQPTLPDA